MHESLVFDSKKVPCTCTRTLWSIVSGCLLMIFACVYSAIHPNLPSPRDSPIRILGRRFGIMVTGLIFPELIVGWAMRQLLCARHITRQFKKHFNYAWTQTHSFFVLMGGFMLYLLREGHIDVPVLTAKQIKDKSKGNLISKGLAILQVAWFVLQLISRVIFHLEITQLEVGTLAFAVFTFIIYAVWWNKPLDVQCPHP
ncbi:uncharacterized protein EDB91DRAFT_1236838 [Suillus paluster]|uniref:uncharacterized protein n=1 Tax=Suillus paluster TaxID=48578 RepID=UPI001B8753F4|nr:uncharacterized protein EDB91DRAFT_1236838 [Suillus paluster]KAG1742646.1 hypothetical protein EDB91DRAFT_1236838 [Suillus paluster]